MIILASILLLLATASAAHAECAWVLWAQHNISGRIMDPSPFEGFQTKAECAKASERLFVDAKKHGTLVNFSCLPDTVDPRGPKGK
jgi:hypothetical protein